MNDLLTWKFYKKEKGNKQCSNKREEKINDLIINETPMLANLV
jgi:hypothetical protein